MEGLKGRGRFFVEEGIKYVVGAASASFFRCRNFFNQLTVASSLIQGLNSPKEMCFVNFACRSSRNFEFKKFKERRWGRQRNIKPKQRQKRIRFREMKLT